MTSSVHRDPTMEAAHRLHEWRKRQAAARRDWNTILRKRRRIQRLLAQALARRR